MVESTTVPQTQLATVINPVLLSDDTEVRGLTWRQYKEQYLGHLRTHTFQHLAWFVSINFSETRLMKLFYSDACLTKKSG